MSKTNLEPAQGRMIVRRMEPETHTKLGIILPESYRNEKRKKLCIGTILAIGEQVVNHKTGKMRHKFPLVEGDRVLFGQYAGNEVEIDGERVLFLYFDDVLAKIED